MSGFFKARRLSERVPRHMLVAASAWISRIVVAFVQLASIRILINGLGMENYSIFVLLIGLLGWFSLSDMGVSVSLQNHISEQRAKNLPYDQQLMAAAAIAAALLGVTVLLLYFVSPYLGSILLRQFKAIDDNEKSALVFLTGTILIVTTLGGIVYKVWYATQKGYLANMFPAVAAAIGYYGIASINSGTSSNRLLYSLVVFLLPGAIFPLCSFIVMVWRSANKISTAWNGTVMRSIFQKAIHFWLIAVMVALILQIDYVVMAQLLGPQDIVIYNMSTKIFGLVLFMYSSILLALWPIFSEKIIKRDWDSVKKYTKSYLSLGLCFMATMTFCLIWIMPFFIKILAPKEHIVIPVGFIILLGFYQMLRVWTDTFATILQSMGDLKPFWAAMPIQALLSVSFQWILGNHFGLYGIVLGLIISFILTSVWCLPWALFKHIKNAKIITV